MNYILFQHNYVKTWNEIKNNMSRWDKVQLLLLGRISVMKRNILPRIMLLYLIYLFGQLFHHLKQWQKDMSKFVRQEKKPKLNISYCKMQRKDEDWVYHN